MNTHHFTTSAPCFRMDAQAPFIPCPHPEIYDRGECCGGACFEDERFELWRGYREWVSELELEEVE